MDIKILNESDIELALYGLGLSHGLTSEISYSDFIHSDKIKLREKLLNVAKRLTPLDKGHNKFLESICVWLELDLPRYIWQDFDTYRIGISKQSEATNHTITKRNLTQMDFDAIIPEIILNELNNRINNGDFIGVKDILPESFLQKRIVCVNYKTIKNIIEQRHAHKLIQFRTLCAYLLENLKHSYLFHHIKNQINPRKLLDIKES